MVFVFYQSFQFIAPVCFFFIFQFSSIASRGLALFLLFVYSTKDVSLTRTAAATKSVLTVVSVTQQSSAATAAQTVSVDVPPTTIHSVQASRRVGLSRRAPATETAGMATSARCTTISATRSVSTTCRSAAVCATGSVRGRPDVACGRRVVPGLRVNDGEPCLLDPVAVRGRRTTNLGRRRQR